MKNKYIFRKCPGGTRWRNLAESDDGFVIYNTKNTAYTYWIFNTSYLAVWGVCFGQKEDPKIRQNTFHSYALGLNGIDYEWCDRKNYKSPFARVSQYFINGGLNEYN